MTGTVIGRGDLPIFVRREGEAPMAGMAVSEQTDVEQARWRYLIEDATWVAAKE